MYTTATFPDLASRRRSVSRRSKAASGFSSFEFVIVCALFGVLGAVLLDRLAYYQEVAEKAYFEYTVSALRNALRTHVATLMVEGRFQDSLLLAGQNPMSLLESMPDNYLGESPPLTPERFVTGNWYFDAGNGTLVYLVKTGRSFESANRSNKTVRIAMVRVGAQGMIAEANGSGVGDGIALRVVEPYTWR